jgi:hypothetical protein
MRNTSFLFSLSLLTLSLLTLVGCNNTPAASDTGSVLPDAAVVEDGGTTVDGGHDAAMPVIDVGSPAADSGETTYMLPDNYCFTFATATSMDSMSHTCGDMLALTGINVDLSSTDGFCPQTGTYTSLASVPSDYASCAWTSYVEGADPLANTGYIVRDAAGAHHYRMRIVSNLHPALVFSFDAID